MSRCSTLTFCSFENVNVNYLDMYKYITITRQGRYDGRFYHRNGLMPFGEIGSFMKIVK